MSIVIGVDAGGTKTSVLVAEGDSVIARSTGAGGAVRPGRALQAASRITMAIRRALTDAGLLHGDVLVVGAAGAGREPERGELRESLRMERLAGKTIVTGDLDIALEAAFGGNPGIVVVSGTGSVAVARDKDGAIHRRGGYGWQIGDEGSGYAIARAALQAVAKARDGRGPATALSDAVLAAGPSETFDDLVRWSTAVDPGEIAALAPAVFVAAEAGDGVARAIVEAAAGELALMTVALLDCFPGKSSVPVALTGGNLVSERGLRAPLLALLKAQPRLKLKSEPFDAAEGALAIAKREISR
jgi:glucosamine kinase